MVRVRDSAGTLGKCLGNADRKRGGVRKLMRYDDDSSSAELGTTEPVAGGFVKVVTGA